MIFLHFHKVFAKLRYQIYGVAYSLCFKGRVILTCGIVRFVGYGAYNQEGNAVVVRGMSNCGTFHFGTQTMKILNEPVLFGLVGNKLVAGNNTALKDGNIRIDGFTG